MLEIFAHPRPTLNNFGKWSVIFGLALVFGSLSPGIAQTAPARGIDSTVQIDVFVPDGLPIRINNPELYFTPEGTHLLRFVATNTSIKSLSDIQFLVMVVGPNGNVRSGYAWKTTAGLRALGTSNIEYSVRFNAERGDRLVLTTYEATGKTETFKVDPKRLVTDLASVGLIKARTGS